MSDKTYDICIIGGGASGIMAAITAAKHNPNLQIVLLEKNDILGRKVLATGNGRCNLTNINATANDYFGADKDFTQKIINIFSPKETIKYFNKIGVITKEEDRGRIFPRSNHASTVVNALSDELNRFGVEIKLKSNVKAVDYIDNRWHILTENDISIYANKIILTTGGRAAHQFGSAGDGLFWLNKKFNIETVEPHAALVPINLDFKYLKEIMGIKLEVELSLFKECQNIGTKKGEIIFTHFGISGPAAMALGRNIINGSDKYSILVDLLPEISSEDLENQIIQIAEQNGTKNIKNIIAGYLPERLATIVCTISNVSPSQKAAEISKKNRKDIILNLKNFTLNVKEVRPFKEAQVTAGGIKISEINPSTLELLKKKNLFVAGEIIDVDGKSGGYNLQWAWSSGYLAGLSAAKGE